MDELAVEYGHNCQDKLPLEELSLILSQLLRQATAEELAVNTITIPVTWLPWTSSPHISSQLPRQVTVEELAVNLSHNCRDLATVEELAVNNSHNC